MGETVGHGSPFPDAPQAPIPIPEQRATPTFPLQDTVHASDYVLLSPEMGFSGAQYLGLEQESRQSALEALIRLHVTADGPHKQGIVGTQINKLTHDKFEMLHPFSPLEAEFFDNFGKYIQMKELDSQDSSRMLTNATERRRLIAWYNRLTQSGRYQIGLELDRRANRSPMDLVSPSGTVDMVDSNGTEHNYKNGRRIRFELERKIREQLQAEAEAHTQTPANNLAA